ncbi:MAG: molybdate ABC transporter substrate-binding protein [Syntrophales bacterium]|jgi:molybdate transport system substrate-binding protein
MSKRFIIFIALLSFLMFPVSALAEGKICIAVAANFIQTFKELASVFEKKEMVQVEATFASSGSLYSQIINGAPYDMFLSADEDRPKRLSDAGLGGIPFIYARGQVILWSANKEFCGASDWQAALRTKDVKKLAIANPDIAPYGMAAKKALEQSGLWDQLKVKLVNAQDVAQAFQYSTTGSVDASFCARSSLSSPEGRNGCYYEMKDAPDIVQSASVLKRAGDRTAIGKFAAFLVSPEAGIIKKKYGYR